MVIFKTALTAAVSFVVLFFLTRLMGRRQISQLDIFDYITGITIGSVAAELATELESPGKPLTAMIVYGVLTVLLNVLTSKSRKAARFINGAPLVLFDAGCFQKGNLKKAKLDLGEFLSLCRGLGYYDLAAVRTAVFEPTGTLTVLPVTALRPATPHDLGLAPPPEPVFTEFVMDGEPLWENLENAGFDEAWLLARLREQGYAGPEGVFLARWDQSGSLTVYPAQG